MKTLSKIIMFATMAVWTDGVVTAQTQTANPERITVTWSDPSRPGLLKVHVMNGGITVKTHSGRDVIIDARTIDRGQGRGAGRRGIRGPDPDAAGLRRLETNTSGLSIEEDNNEMEIGTSIFNQNCCTELEIQVPVRTNLELTSMSGGSITVDGTEGEIEVTNMNGPVTLNNVAGSVMAHSMNGKVAVSLRQVAANKPMAFSTMNGPVDVTLPANTKANLQMRTGNGEIYTAFDVQPRPSGKSAVQDNRKQGGRFELQIDAAVMGSINGGGPEFEFRTMNGSIYIRQGK